MAKIEDYKVNHLFLLMGENPLPNYIAALTLLNRDSTAYLVHTNRTKLQALRLQQVIAQDNYFKQPRLVDLGERQADAHYIWQQIYPFLQYMNSSIGLNYTGGTKAMSVHAYRAIEHFAPESVFSYLDANTLEIYFDRKDAESDRIKILPQISLSQIFKLHGLLWREPPSDQPTRPDIATQLAKLYQNPDGEKAWKEWRRNFRSRTRIDNQWKSELELQRLSAISLRDLPSAFQLALESMGATNLSLQLSQTCNHGFPSCTNVCEWLDGIWLEHYVLAQVQQIAKSADIQECKMSFRIDEKASQSRRWEKFEFDVAFVRNYQLFALSCTTVSDRSTCKNKLFEAHTRAKQLGGAEARVGLVCCHDFPDSLRSELEVERRDQRVAVFGRDDLGDLGQKILNWVKQNQ